MEDASTEMLSIFAGALEQSLPEKRAAFLDAACGANAQLRQRIDALLHAHDKAGGFLQQQPEPANVVATVDDPVTERPGTVIGPYKLLQQIGEGGMGTVFMAEQSHPVQRKVALKVIKPGMDSRQVIARFEAERQALALMDHPNIAKVLDAGTINGERGHVSAPSTRGADATPLASADATRLAGRPYFVMELVKGVPITRYCDEHHLTPRERLELFVPVCQAIQHAHQKGIIHRDIKPSNVMVCIYDGKPVPKVIDFGVAKATGPKLTQQTLYTEFGAIVGTFEYMSPEQAQLDQLDIDTRSDIYSLGVLLYELLTGTTPLERKRMKEVAVLELLRLVREEEAPRPSTRLSTAEALPSIAANRGTEPRKLSGMMRGELDWIVMKSLEKDRDRRYESANGLAHDIERHLHDEPVQACPPSASYKMRKFVRRNRGAVLGAAMFVAALIIAVGGLMVSAIQSSRSYEAERKAHQQAEANFQRARGAVDEYFTMVSQSKLFDVPGLQPLRRELLEAAVRYYQALAEERSEDPSVRAGLAVAHLRLAGVYYEVDRINDAVASFSAGLDHVDELLRQFPDKPELLRQLAGIWKGTRRLSGFAPVADDVAAAEHALNRFIQIWEKLAAQNPSEAAFQSDLALVYDRTSQLLATAHAYGRAIAFCRKALDLWEGLTRAYPNEPEYQAALAEEYSQLGAELGWGGKPEEADKWDDNALALRERLAASYPNVAPYREGLADSITIKAGQLSKKGKTKQADAMYLSALESWRKLAEEYPNAHLYRRQLGNIYTQLKQWDKAVAEYSKVIELRPDHPAAFAGRAIAYDALKQRDKAIADYTQAIELDPKNVGAWTNRAFAYSQLKQYDKALADYSKAIELEPKLVWGWTNRAWAYRALGQLDKALADLTKAIELDPKNSLALRGRALTYSNLNQYDKAIGDLIKAIELDPKDALPLNNLAWLLATCPETKFRDTTRAVASAKKAVELKPKDGDHWNTLGVAQYRAGDWKAAIATLEKSMELRKGGDSFDWFFLAMARWQLGDKKDARKWYDQAVQWMEKNQPKDEELARFRAEAEELLGVKEKEK
jgi:serine/threonine protein kinase/tetratricopeptide (TPR) repeat protein